MINQIASGKRHILQSASAVFFLILLLNGVTWVFPPESKGADPRDAVESKEADEEKTFLNTIFERFDAKAYREVINLIERYFEKHPLTEENIYYVHLKATAHLALKETDQAIAAYEKTLPMVRKLHNVSRRKFAKVFFILGDLYHEIGKKDEAISFMEEGLALEPQSTVAQIILGEYYVDAGKKERAVSHYLELPRRSGLERGRGGGDPDEVEAAPCGDGTAAPLPRVGPSTVLQRVYDPDSSNQWCRSGHSDQGYLSLVGE